jgi:hypothetical protein
MAAGALFGEARLLVHRTVSSILMATRRGLSKQYIGSNYQAVGSDNRL